MIRFNLFFYAFFILLLHACGGPVNQETSGTAAEDSTATPSKPKAPVSTPAPVLENPECDPAGPVLEGNKLWIAEKALSVFIVKDEGLESGNPNRLVKVFEGADCTQKFKTLLPENSNPDFPYYLAPINYNNTHQLVAIQGFDKVYCLDLKQLAMLPELEPAYQSERMYVDASSGMIKRVELWEDYLIGFAQDMGSFVFDLSDKSAPKAVMPVAEYQISESQFSSLFLLKSAKNGQQLVLPTFNYEEDDFEINPMMPKPSDIDATIQESARDNRFIVLRELMDNTKKAILIDMEAQKRLPLPNDLREAGVQGILKWAKENAG